MDAERRAGLRRIVNSAIADNYEDELFTVDQCRDLLDALDAAEARAEEWRTSYIDSVKAMLVAAGAPEDIDAMEAEVRLAGTKPSHYIAQLRAERDRLREAAEGAVRLLGQREVWSPAVASALDLLGRALNRPECREDHP